MITEDYVSFETAKLLKGKGFNEPTLNTYLQFEEGMVDMIQYRFTLPNSENSKVEYNCPTHQMAAKWLREKHKLFIQIMLDSWALGSHSGYYILLQKTDSEYEELNPTQQVFYNTYEQAMEAALQYCLTKLI